MRIVTDKRTWVAHRGTGERHGDTSGSDGCAHPRPPIFYRVSRQPDRGQLVATAAGSQAQASGGLRAFMRQHGRAGAAQNWLVGA